MKVFRIINNLSKKYILVSIMLVLVCVSLTLSYASFTMTSSNHKITEMYINSLSSTITINGENINTVSVPGNSNVVVTLVVNSADSFETKYKAYYSTNENIYVGYYPSGDVPFGTLGAQESKTISLKLNNSSSNAIVVTIGVSKGYANNELSDIVVPLSNTEINSFATISVTYSAGSNATVSPTSNEIIIGGVYGTLPTPIRTNYTFVGWFTAESGGTQLLSTTSLILDSNHSIYAHWSISLRTAMLVRDNTAYADNVTSVNVSKSTGIDFTYPSGSVNVYSSSSVSGGSTLTMEPSSYGYYFYPSYSFDQGSGYYVLSGTRISGKYSSIYSSTVGYYTCYDSYTTSCTTMYKVGSATSTSMTPSYTYTSQISSTFNNGDGLYYTSNLNKTEDMNNDGTGDVVYYFRGNAIHTNIIFGQFATDQYNGINLNNDYITHIYTTQALCEASFGSGKCTKFYSAGDKMCWKIVRINENGTIRLRFNGAAIEGSCESPLKSSIGSSSVNKGSENAYFGYMYGTPGSSTYAAEHANTNDNVHKILIDSWYDFALLPYASYIGDAIYCNDRSLTSGTGIGSTKTIYAAARRTMYNGSTWSTNVGNQQYKCPQNADKFTKSSTIGNGKLTRAIALLSADELVYAGFVNSQLAYDDDIFLSTASGSLMTMSPGMHEEPTGYIPFYPIMTINTLPSLYSMTTSAGSILSILPSISLVENIQVSDIGDGSVSNPYIAITN